MGNSCWQRPCVIKGYIILLFYSSNICTYISLYYHHQTYCLPFKFRLQNNFLKLILVDTNLIQLDTDDMATNTNTYADNDDDLIFEVSFITIYLFWQLQEGYLCIFTYRRKDIYIREYQDMNFFPDQLQTFIERCIEHQRFQMWKNFSKISIPFRQV